MVRVIENIIRFLLFFILMPGIMSCIDEYNSDCIRGIYIYFKPENPKHNYPDMVRTVDLYFYDEAGELATKYTYSKEELYSNEKAAFVENLPSGNYTLVSIINDVETYHINHEQQLETLQSYLKDKVIDYPLVDFFSGILEITVGNKPRLQKVTADIFKHNNNIRLEIITDGYDLRPGVTFHTYIEGDNGAYQHHSTTCIENHVIKYLPHDIKIDKNYIPITCDFTIMRLWRNADLTIHLKEEIPFQGIVHSIRLNIADELAKIVNHQKEYLYDTDEKLSYHDEYKIVITLGPDFIMMELTINDWTIIRGGVNV